jgi:acetylornithine deacetylase/succinyl-diaminopimelate desuccinylase-like protein
MSLPADSEIVRRLAPVMREAGLDPAPKAKPTSTEGGVFVRAGAQALVFGPSPSTGNAHCANEFALLDEVDRAIDLYAQMIRALAAPP